MIAIGDKVVCVDNTNPSSHNVFPKGELKRGEVYIVAGFTLFGDYDLGLKIVGKPSISALYGQECGWNINRFRKHEDIKVMNAMESFLKSKGSK